MGKTLGSKANATLGANLKAARERAERDQGEAAIEAGLGGTQKLAQNLLSLWERGKQTPNISGLLRLAVLYKCPLDDFFGGVDAEYDEIIEGRIPLNIKQHYEARRAIRRREAVAMIDALIGRAESAPPPKGAAADQKAKRGKSAPVQSRRKQSRPK